jgi:hypothetical protein
MKRGNIWGLGLGLGLTTFAGIAGAQEAAPATAPAAAADGHASGLMLQGRLQASSGLLSLGGGPSFLVGYQAPSFALGLGLGLNRISVSSGEDDLNGAVTMFQIVPTALFDVWHSADGRSRANVIAGVGYGRASFDSTSNRTTCVTDATGNDVCTTSKDEASASAGFVPFMIGFGGDHYLSRNFALGAEVGIQAAFTTGLDTESNGTSRSIDASGNLQVAYGALRATFVLGD